MQDISIFTLAIKDSQLREEFSKLELMQVKRRWEIVTVILIMSTLLALILVKDDVEAMIGLILTLADVLTICVLMSILGRVKLEFHHASLPLIIFTRCVWTYA